MHFSFSLSIFVRTKSRTWHFQPATARPNISNSCLGSIACSIMTCPCMRIKPCLAKCKTVESALFKYVCCKYFRQMHNKHIWHDMTNAQLPLHLSSVSVFVCVHQSCVEPSSLCRVHGGNAAGWRESPKLPPCTSASTKRRRSPVMSWTLRMHRIFQVFMLEILGTFGVPSVKPSKAPQKLFQKRGHQSHSQYLTINPIHNQKITSPPNLTQVAKAPKGLLVLWVSTCCAAHPPMGLDHRARYRSPNPTRDPASPWFPCPRTWRRRRDSKKSGGYS